MGGDEREAAARVAAFVEAWETAGWDHINSTSPWRNDPGRLTLSATDLRAVLAENARMREELAAADDPGEYGRWLIRNLGAAYAAGWETHADLVTATLATLGSGKREQCSRAWIADRLADLTGGEEPAGQQPEPCDGNCDCDCQPGQPCLCPERDCYCGPCPVCGETPQQPVRDTADGDGEATCGPVCREAHAGQPH